MAIHRAGNGQKNMSEAHARALQLFEDDSTCSDWIVVHDFSWTTQNPLSAPNIPFLILIPDVGFVVLELENRSTVRGIGGEPDAAPLFRSVQGSVRQLTTLLGQDFPHLKDRLFCIGMLAPLMRLYETTGDWEAWQAIDKRPLKDHGIGESILRLCTSHSLKHQQNGGNLGRPNTQDILDVSKAVSRYIPSTPDTAA